jgi:hypothetical protein
LPKEKCPWHLNGNHTTEQCYQLRHALKSFPEPPHPHDKKGKKNDGDNNDFQEPDKTVNVLFGRLTSRREQKATHREVMSIEPAVPTPLRLRLATLVSADIAAQSPRRGETSPRRGKLPCLAQMCIWHNRGWIKSGPKPADPRMSPATPSRTERENVRSARVSSDSPLSCCAAATSPLTLPRGAAGDPDSIRQVCLRLLPLLFLRVIPQLILPVPVFLLLGFGGGGGGDCYSHSASIRLL